MKCKEKENFQILSNNLKNLRFSAVFLYGVFMWEGIKYGPTYVYPWWAEAIGWLLALSSMICLPIGAGHAWWKVCQETSDLVGKESSSSLFKKVHTILSLAGLLHTLFIYF